MPTEPAYDPNMLVAVVGITVALAIIFFRWLHELSCQVPPDPWPADIDQAVRQRDAMPICVECLSPQPGHPWFCPCCGFPTGEYVTTMPYLQIFATGELLRRGVTGPPERGISRSLFFALVSLTQYSLFFPVYWFWMVRKAVGHPICPSRRATSDFKPGEAPTDSEPGSDPS